MIKKISLLLLFLAVAFGVFAQNITVKGFVYDGDWGEPLLGVNISYGPGLGTVTDLDGSFSLKLTPGKYTLEVSYVGFEKQFKEIEV
ncbi:MAG: carboxypeptidase-like regulatory domain-containing protein, partial [Bacteroidales bacterium]|nr:carboxypeptidase-like regulatory domain-containing protein [Bacteroidales bacterium]